MTDLIQQAEALEAQARTKDTLAAMNRADATDFRAEAAKLREQAREPRRCWTGWYEVPHKVCCSYETKAELENCRVNGCAPIYGCEMVEVRPVRITDAELLEKWTSHVLVGHSELAPRLRAFINALSLAGVGVEK